METGNRASVSLSLSLCVYLSGSLRQCAFGDMSFIARHETHSHTIYVRSIAAAAATAASAAAGRQTH